MRADLLHEPEGQSEPGLRRAGVASSRSTTIWLVSFVDLGYLDDETCRLEPVANPFDPEVLPMSPE
jgi:hypothetical protein